MPTHDDTTEPLTMDQKMDVIIHHLERIDRRDRLRMWGSFFRSILALIPLVFFAWSTWYLYEHADELIETIVKQTAASTANSAGQSYEEMMRQIREAMGGGTGQ